MACKVFNSLFFPPLSNPHMASTGDLPNSHVPSPNPGYHTSQKTSANRARGQSRLTRVKKPHMKRSKRNCSPLSSAAAAMNAIQIVPRMNELNED